MQEEFKQAWQWTSVKEKGTCGWAQMQNRIHERRKQEWEEYTDII